jgi:hypothetical protein
MSNLPAELRTALAERYRPGFARIVGRWDSEKTAPANICSNSMTDSASKAFV